MRKLLALLLVVALLLTGCGFPQRWDFYTPFSEMTYTRPDMDHLQQTLDAACAAAENAMTMTELENRIMEYYTAYDRFFTNYNLAYIHYCQDTSNAYWSEEQAFCAEYAAVPDAGLETLYQALAGSHFRSILDGPDYFGEGFLSQYESGSLYDDTVLAYLEQEAALLEQYYSICADAGNADDEETFYSNWGLQLESLFVELVALRQALADYAGYPSFTEFAYDFLFYRDYTPGQARAYFESIRKELVPLYRQLDADSLAEQLLTPCTEQQVLHYVEQTAKAMGGPIEDAFTTMKRLQLYDISYSPNKYDISFEVYLDSYGVPFIFMKPYGAEYDKLALAHEFGHFCNDYVCGGSYAGADVAEVLSQAMEYLSLCYTDEGQALEPIKLVDALCVYVEQSAYALFEHEVYALEPEDLTVENIRNLYLTIGTDYGFDSADWDIRDYVLIPHFFTEPLYITSYVASNDVAFQLYLKEKEKSGAGLDIYKRCLSTDSSYLVEFTGLYGLENPFTPVHVSQLRQHLETLIP